MPYVFNPFTGNFDVVDTNTAAGSDTEVQFNDNGSLNGDTGLTFNKTTNALTVGASTVDGGSARVYGDINLDDGGSFSTTVQAVTPTANRTISFPDATGTVALVNGASGTIQYNDAGTLKGNSDFTIDLDWNDAAVTFTGLKLNVTNTASASGSKLLDLQSGGTSRFNVDSFGTANVFVQAGFTNEGLSIGATNSSAQTKLSFSDGLFFSGTGTYDIVLRGDGSADTLAQRRGTNAQTFRLYNTYTDASNFERTSLTRDSSGLVIDAQKGGTGANPTNLLDLKLDGASQLSVTSGGVVRSNAFYVSPTTNNGIVNGSGATLSLRRAGIEYLNIGTNALTVRDGTNLVFNTITGTKIGTATNQKLGFYNATPVVQPTTAVSSATVVGGGGTAVDDATTFNGYTLAQVVQALQNLGILA